MTISSKALYLHSYSLLYKAINSNSMPGMS